MYKLNPYIIYIQQFCTHLYKKSKAPLALYKTQVIPRCITDESQTAKQQTLSTC